jgi:hypothetical protein
MAAGGVSLGRRDFLWPPEGFVLAARLSDGLRSGSSWTPVVPMAAGGVSLGRREFTWPPEGIVLAAGLTLA